MRTSVNGALDEVNGLVTQWTLRADKVGTFTLGPAQITVGGTKRSAAPVRVRVVERGKGNIARPRGEPAGRSVRRIAARSVQGPVRLRRRRSPRPSPPRRAPIRSSAWMRRATPVAFLHATVDKTRAVVGEQVTLSVYLYEDPYARQGRPGDVHEANANDFVKRSLVEDETRAVGVGTALVGGKLWNVKLIRKNALFPLKTGHLAIEPMSMTLAQARVGLRASETLYVDVSEPPVAGRPAGYAMGDVGDMSLQATVTPRAIFRDGAIGVNIELRGTGNLPSQLTLPVVPGVEWLEPTMRDKLGPMQNDRFGGTRTFSYVVRVHKEGAVDLGEVRLPYYDADKRTYAVARATLGIVNVAPGAARDAGADEPEVVLAGMPKERRVLEGPHPQTFLAERAALLGGALRLAARVRARARRARRPRSVAREACAPRRPPPIASRRTRRAEAEDACRGEDGKAAMGAIARAVEADVLVRTDVNLRGAAGDTVEERARGRRRRRARRPRASSRSCAPARTRGSRPTASTSRRRARPGAARRPRSTSSRRRSKRA